MRLVRNLIQSEQLFPVEDSPLITLPVYMVYPLDRQEAHITTAIKGLRELGAEEDLRQSLDDLSAAS